MTTLAPARGAATIASARPESPASAVLRRVLRNPQGAIALAGLALLLVGALGAPWLSRAEPNAQNAAERFLPPSQAISH